MREIKKRVIITLDVMMIEAQLGKKSETRIEAEIRDEQGNKTDGCGAIGNAAIFAIAAHHVEELGGVMAALAGPVLEGMRDKAVRSAFELCGENPPRAWKVGDPFRATGDVVDVTYKIQAIEGQRVTVSWQYKGEDIRRRTYDIQDVDRYINGGHWMLVNKSESEVNNG